MKKETVNKSTVASNIRRVRQELGLSMDEFASRIDDRAKSGTVSNWETGKNLPNNERLKKIADLGNITIDELLYGSKEDYVHQVIADYAAAKGDTVDLMAEKLILLDIVVHYPDVYSQKDTIIDKYSSIVYGNQGSMSSEAFFDLYERSYATTTFINFLNELHQRATNLVEYTEDENPQRRIEDIKKEVEKLASLNENINQLLKEFDLDFTSKRRNSKKSNNN